MNEHLSAVQQFAVWILPVVFAITMHEAAHGYMALLCGDRTAKMLGRVSLNPLRHVDPWGTIVIPGVAILLGGPLFGWAKPVPVNFQQLRHLRRDMVLVALAGPVTNIVLAAISMLGFYLVRFIPGVAQEWTLQNLANSVQINLILAVFNMLPIPPLDGGRVVYGLLPPKLAVRYGRLERYGLVIVLGLFLLLPMLLQRSGGLNPFIWLVQYPAALLERVLGSALGIL